MVKIPERKYLAEHAIGFINDYVLVLQANEISDPEMKIPPEVKPVLDNCHIYMLCSRPRFTFDPLKFGTVVKEGMTFLEGNINWMIKGVKHSFAFSRLVDPVGSSEFRLSEFPHNEFYVTNSEKVELRVPASELVIGKYNELGIIPSVLYVGQSIGDGSKSAFERLKSHSTLQRVFADTLTKSPDQEIIALLLQYNDYRIFTNHDGCYPEVANPEANSDRFYSIMDHPLDLKEKTSLVEAALIRYFQPKYNLIFKENFPSEKHKVLEKCLELDIASLIVELNTEDVYFPLCSEKVEVGVHHLAQFDLYDVNKRAAFVSYVEDDGSYLPSNLSGPKY